MSRPDCRNCGRPATKELELTEGGETRTIRVCSGCADGNVWAY